MTSIDPAPFANAYDSHHKADFGSLQISVSSLQLLDKGIKDFFISSDFLKSSLDFSSFTIFKSVDRGCPVIRFLIDFDKFFLFIEIGKNGITGQPLNTGELRWQQMRKSVDDIKFAESHCLAPLEPVNYKYTWRSRREDPLA